VNRHFVAVAEPVLNNNGFIDKYIGDGILAAFGTRDESPTNACRNAVRAALGMQDAAKVTPTDYDKILRALLWTLEEFLADDYLRSACHRRVSYPDCAPDLVLV
jgi:hypothetical protein